MTAGVAVGSVVGALPAQAALTIAEISVGPALTITDVSLTEGNAGTTSFVFTVNLSGAAPAGGVTFDIATADGTGTSPSDYTATSLTGQTIPAGSSNYSFSVLVNGDSTPEINETFVVNVSTSPAPPSSTARARARS